MVLIVDRDMTVLSGNIWLEAARDAGYTEVPVIIADHLSPAEAEAFMLANVRLIERGQWDQQKLGEILRDLTLEEIDFDLDITGFDPPEIDALILDLDSCATDDGKDDVIPSPGPAVSRLDDLWLLGGHRLCCNDALDLAAYNQLLAGATAAVLTSDPPYNVRIARNVSGLGQTCHREFVQASGEMTSAEFAEFLARSLGAAALQLSPGALAYIFMDWRHSYELTVVGRRIFERQLNLCIWAKTNGGMGSFYRSAHELIFLFKKAGGSHTNNVQLGRFGRNRTNIWTYPGANTFGRGGEEGDLLALHPTVKPVGLLADILLDATVRGDIVLDPFCGSGSILIAAEMVGRRAYGIELDPLYVDTAVRRWQRWSGEAARLEATGQTFDEVAAERAEEDADG